MGNGNRTRNRRSHSPVLCQLSYSHRNGSIITESRVLSREYRVEKNQRVPSRGRRPAITPPIADESPHPGRLTILQPRWIVETRL